jgi:FtsP/CotA-like multicopper oxidase with cupredoxin domain
MRQFAFKKTRFLLSAVLASTAIAIGGSAASAAPVSIELCALPGTLAPLPVSSPTTEVPIWGFGIPSTSGDCTTAVASLPGPVLEVNAGDVVTIDLINALPAGHGLSFEIPGITFDAGAVDGTDPIVFTASHPGTYMYQSGGDAGRQEAMGLYGAFIVHSLTVGQAYDDAVSAYDAQTTLVLSQVDPTFNTAMDADADPSVYDYRATWWLINGKAYPDTDPIQPEIGQRQLLRYLNAGYDNTTMTMLGMHQQVIARDGSLLLDSFLAAAETIPTGGTEDAIFVAPAGAYVGTNGFPLYNRQFHITNGDPDSAPAGPGSSTILPPGGMLTFIQPQTPPPLP